MFVKPTISEKVERVVRSWNQWSPAEQRGMDCIVEEFLSHGRDGDGNGFVRSVWDRVVQPYLDAIPTGWRDLNEGPWDTLKEAAFFADAEVGATHRIVKVGKQYFIIVRCEIVE